MIWDQIFGGILVLVRSEVAIIQFHHMGILPITAFLITAVCTDFRVAFLFASTGLVDWLTLKLGKKHRRLGERIVGLTWLRKIDESLKNGKKRIITWLIGRSKFVIFLILFIPFIPFDMGDIAIVVARIARIKGVFPLMLIANTAKTALVTFFIYHVF